MRGWVRLIGLLGWVGLHTCCALSNHCAQVKSAITAHSGHLRHGCTKHLLCIVILNLGNKLVLTSQTCVLVLEVPSESHLAGVRQPPSWCVAQCRNVRARLCSLSLKCNGLNDWHTSLQLQSHCCVLCPYPVHCGEDSLTWAWRRNDEHNCCQTAE